MTLKKALKYIDCGIKVRIWDINKENPIYDGWTFDIPKHIKKNYRLIKRKENGDAEAMFPIGDGYLRITVVNKKEDK
jgi:hypothetical protein